MDILATTRRKGPLLLAVFMVAVLGAALFANTFQSISREREAVREHMGLTARVVLRAVEISLGRGMGMRGRMGDFSHEQGGAACGPGSGVAPCEQLEPGNGSDAYDGDPPALGAGTPHGRLRPDVIAFFRDLQQSEAVLFVTVFDETGGRPLGASSASAEEVERLLEPSRRSLVSGEENEWEGVVQLDDSSGYLYARQAVPRLALLLDQTRQNHQRWMQEGPPRVFLAVALDMTEHMKAYRQFRRNGLFQALALTGAAVALLGLGAGFAKRRRAVARAAYLERFQSRLLDSMPDGLISVAPDNMVQAANPAAHDILGAATGELVGHPCDMLGGEAAKANGWRELEVGGRRLELLTVSLPGGGPSDQSQGTETGESGSERLIILRDRTEFKEMEEHLAEARKLAAIGALAAGVAHEIRNPLSALRGFAQFFAKRFAGKEPEEAYARTMVQESDRLNRVVTDMLYLSKPREVRRRLVVLSEMADDLQRLLRLDLEEKGVRLTTDFAAPAVWADPDQLKQVLLNLVLNSVQALQEMDPQDPERSWVQLESEETDQGCVIRVRDAGPGMTAEQREQAFEPFFTTKDKGAGLGLAMVHAIMRRHEGRAGMESAPGRGTVVSLFFPNGDGGEDD